MGLVDVVVKKGVKKKTKKSKIRGNMQNAELLGMPKIMLNKSDKNEEEKDIDILGVREELGNASTMDLIVLDDSND